MFYKKILSVFHLEVTCFGIVKFASNFWEKVGPTPKKI